MNGRKRRSRSLLGALLGLAVSDAATAGPDGRAAFIGLHRCEIVGRLEEIHRRGPVHTSRDRFIAIGMEDDSRRYVQCIFHERDTAMFCEAASGAYGPDTDAKPRLRLDPPALAALHALGFRQEDAGENFSRDLPLGDPPNVGLAADLMLGALYDAYGARPGGALDIRAPRGGRSGAGCAPTS